MAHLAANIIDEVRVSSYVLEMLGLDDGPVSRLLCVKFLNATSREEKVITVGRALRHFYSSAHLSDVKLCVDEEDDVVYVLLPAGLMGGLSSASVHRGRRIMVENEHVRFRVVSSVVPRPNSQTKYFNIAVRIKVVSPKDSLEPLASVPFSLNVEDVSLFICDHFGLKEGTQTRLLAAKGLSNVRLVTRAIRQNRGKEFLAIYKFAMDSLNGTVYILVTDEADANMMAGRSWTIDGHLVTLYRVLNVSVRPQAVDFYRRARVDQVHPLSELATVYGI